MGWTHRGSDRRVSVALAIGCLYIGFRASCTIARWFADQLIVPARDRAFTHLDKTSNALDRLSNTLDAMCETMDRRSGEDRTAEEKRHAEASLKLSSIHTDVEEIKRHVVPAQHRASMDSGK